MTKTLAALSFLVVMASAALAQQITKEDVIKLVKEGIGEETIVAKIRHDKATFVLSTDDILALKKAGVPDKVIAAMIESTPPGTQPSAPPLVLEKEANVIVKNSSHAAVFLTVDPAEKVFNVSRSKGSELAVDKLAGWRLAEGAWTIAIEGHKTIDVFTVGGAQGVNLTFQGANTSYVELVTLIAQDKNGRQVSIISSVGKVSEDQRMRRSGIRRPGDYEGMMGPRFHYLPYVTDTVLLGAGIGAIIGHHYHRTGQGALIGAAAGLTLDIIAGWHWRR
jgi:hypothetical protein